MSGELINLELVEIALEHTTGADFEKFSNAFYPALAGIDFVPLGGVHDGGADAFFSDVREGSASAFYQSSIQRDYKAKIKNTITRLREFGREPKVLTYVMPHEISSVDIDEESLSHSTGVVIKIRQRQWIVGNVNYSNQTIAAFRTYLEPHTRFLQGIGSPNFIRSDSKIGDRTLCVFLGQEAERRTGNAGLLEAVTDSLILWALEGTDPDKKIFMTRDQILEKILDALPIAKQIVKGSLDDRLEKLEKKNNTNGREIQCHRPKNLYCLPFQTRKIIEIDNREDEYLRIRVLEQFRAIATQDLEPVTAELAANSAMAAIELTFEKEGLELASFISGAGGSDIYSAISDQIDEVLESEAVSGQQRIDVKDVCLKIIRHGFYASTEEQRLLFGKLSRTYALLFSLKAEPHIVEYFRTMAKQFVLYVGTDLLLGALSERYLPSEDQMRVNMLRILKESGAKLILSEPTLQELHYHIKTTDWEFLNYFAEFEPYMTMDLVRQCSKILVRSYFYARLDTEPRVPAPGGWKSFIGQVCTYDKLHGAQGQQELKSYLVDRFGMDYESHNDLRRLTDSDEVAALAEKLRTIKKDDTLAENDARQVLAVYGKREAMGDSNRSNPFGFGAWWLTHESRVRQFTGEIVHKHNAGYIIRPEFILNFIALAPSAAEVRRTYKNVFPSLLGVRLSGRMREEIFHNAMDKLKAAKEVDGSRIKVMLGELSNRLKGDNFKRYENEISKGRIGAGLE